MKRKLPSAGLDPKSDAPSTGLAPKMEPLSIGLVPKSEAPSAGFAPKMLISFFSTYWPKIPSLYAALFPNKPPWTGVYPPKLPNKFVVGYSYFYPPNSVVSEVCALPNRVLDSVLNCAAEIFFCSGGSCLAGGADAKFAVKAGLVSSFFDSSSFVCVYPKTLSDDGLAGAKNRPPVGTLVASIDLTSIFLPPNSTTLATG